MHSSLNFFGRGIVSLLTVFFFAGQLSAATLTTLTTRVGKTPESIAYNSGHFVPLSNTDDWWHYANVSGVRLFITPSIIEPNDDIAGHGDGVTSAASFVSRKAALRGDPLNTSYINWPYVTPRFGTTATHGSNFLNPLHSATRLRALGVKILINFSASPGQFPIVDANDWAGKWELWQHFYFEAFYFARNFDVERFQMYNEPDLDAINLVTDYFPRLQLASDAVQSAVADVNRLYGKSLVGRMLAPVTAGTATGDYSTWGKMIVTNRHLNFLGQIDPNFNVIGQYDYHEYNSTPGNYGSGVASLNNSLATDMSPEPRYPTSISEFNVHTASTFYSLPETLDTPIKYSRFGAIVANLANNSCNELYCFKFSQTIYNDTIPVKKNGMHFVDNTNAPYNIGGITKAGEVYRLFSKAARPGRDRLNVTKGSGTSALDITATFDPGSKWYHLFSANDSVGVDVTLDAAAWNLPAGQRVLLEEVSENIPGGTKSMLTVSNNQLTAGTHAADTVWLFSAPTSPQELPQTLRATDDATVQDGANRALNSGSNSVCLVKNNSTNASERSATFLKFPLPTIYLPDIQFALLTVRGVSIGVTSSQVHVYGLTNNNWSEASITWSNAPNLKQNISAGFDYTNNFIAGQGTGAQMVGQFLATTVSQDRMIDVTRFIQEHPASDVSFLLAREVRFQGDIQDSDGLSIISKETSTNLGPRLVLVRAKDSDGDGISDEAELNVFGTNPNNADTDNDGVSDGQEILVVGSDPGTFAGVAPSISIQPTGDNVSAGQSVTFNVTAQGSKPIFYQWFFNGTNAIANATNSSLTLTNLQVAQSGNYNVVVSNSMSFIKSSNALLVVTQSPALQTFFVRDPFLYNAGSDLAPQGGWLLNSGTSGKIESGNLAVAGLAPSSGNRFTWDQASMSVRLPIGTNVTSGEAFFSFALRADTVGSVFTAEGTLAGFTTGTGTSFGTKINCRPNGAGGFQIGLSKGGGSTFGAWAANNFVAGETIFVVGRYIFNGASGNDDLCDLWLNPDSATFGAVTAPAATLAAQGIGGTDLAQIDRFFFRCGGSSSSPAKLVADELRIGSNWSAVTEPAPVSLEILLNNTTVILSWPADPKGFVLEQSSDLSLDWLPVTNSVSTSEGKCSVNLPTVQESRLYRLSK